MRKYSLEKPKDSKNNVHSIIFDKEFYTLENAVRWINMQCHDYTVIEKNSTITFITIGYA